MKRCPECRRDYYDDTLLYCLEDGVALVQGSVPVPGGETDERATAVLVPFSEPATAIFGAKGTPVNDSIAVLPLANISADPDNEYFCDGLAEELLNALTKIESLKVAARTSAFSFKNKNEHISEIGRVLGVSTILEGSVRRSGDLVRITVQIVNAADGYQIWSERYDREMKDIFAVQDEITLAVVEALKVKLLGGERSAILQKATADPEAYENYLRGRAFWNRRTPADFEKAIEYFERAIAIDPQYSLAFSGIADSYALLAYFEIYAPDQLRDRARTAAEKAIELDDTSAESHTAMAMYRLVFEFDMAATEFHFLRAIAINPRFVNAQYLYGTHLARGKRFDEAYERGKIALQVDPLNQPLNGNVARALYFARRYEDAIDLGLKNLEIAPDFFFTHYILGMCYREIGRSSEAIDHLGKAVESSGIVALKGDLGVAFARFGRIDEAREILADLTAESEGRYVSPQWSSVIYASLGEKEKALEYLEKAWEVRGIQLLWLAVDPNFDSLRGEARFNEILKNFADVGGKI